MKHWYKTIALGILAIASFGEGAVFAMSPSRPTPSPTVSSVTPDSLHLSQRFDRGRFERDTFERDTFDRDTFDRGRFERDRVDQDQFSRLGKRGACRVTRRPTGIYRRANGQDRIETLSQRTVIRLQEDNRNYDYIRVAVLGEDLEGYISTNDLIPCESIGTVSLSGSFCQEVTANVTLYDGPGTNFTPREQLTPGDEVLLNPETRNFARTEGDEWIQVTTRFDLTGWILGLQGGRRILRDCQ